MKIQSKFKDYYDYVEYLYSQEGGDPSNTYVRKELSQPDQPDSSNVYVNVNETERIPEVPTRRDYYGEILPWAFKWCSVCGELYLLVSKISFTPDWRLITEDHPSLRMVHSSHRRWFEEIRMDEIWGVPNKSCVDISRQLQVPVFVIEPTPRFSGLKKSPQVAVSREIPILGKLGFASAIPAEQMYQNISMFMASLRDSPDSVPPVSVSDKDRLVQKGFDAKISFRGKFPRA
jgi:hypothetical protein